MKEDDFFTVYVIRPPHSTFILLLQNLTFIYFLNYRFHCLSSSWTSFANVLVIEKIFVSATFKKFDLHSIILLWMWQFLFVFKQTAQLPVFLLVKFKANFSIFIIIDLDILIYIFVIYQIILDFENSDFEKFCKISLSLF